MENGLIHQLVVMMNDKFKGGNWKVSVVGLEYIFAVLYLIAEIMIYRLPVRDSIDRSDVKRFKDTLKELRK